MRYIEVKHYSKPNKSSVLIRDKYYSVFLDWDRTVYFPSLKDVNSFLARLNDLLTEIVIDIVDIHVSLNQEVWHYYLNYPGKSDPEFEVLDGFRKNIYLIFKLKNNPNHNLTVITKLYTTIQDFQDLNDKISDRWRLKNQYNEVRRLTRYKNKLAYLKARIDNIEKELKVPNPAPGVIPEMYKKWAR